MIQKETKLLPYDNTGVKFLKCINIQYKHKPYGSIGDLLGVVITKFKSKKKLLKKKIYFGLVISVKKKVFRQDGIYVKCDTNRVVLLNPTNLQFLGTRIYGPIFKEVKNVVEGKKKIVKFNKIVSLSKKTI